MQKGGEFYKLFLKSLKFQNRSGKLVLSWVATPDWLGIWGQMDLMGYFLQVEPVITLWCLMDFWSIYLRNLAFYKIYIPLMTIQ